MDAPKDQIFEIDDVTVAPPFKICVAGNIAAGKTTLSESLARQLGYELCEEPSDENPYLTDFYKDKAANAFQCQVAFLDSSFGQHARIIADLKEDGGIVQDRGPFEDVIFARMLHESGDIDERDYLTYLSLFDTLVANLGENVPDVVIYLDVGVNELMRRVQKRGRDCEKGGGVDGDYLAQLAQQYERFVEEMGKRTTVFRLNWNTFKPTSSVWEGVVAQYDGGVGVKMLLL